MSEEMFEKTVSRRAFLKIAGVAGASIGVAGGLGGVLAACGGTDKSTTTTAAAATTTTGAASTDTTVAAETTTSVSTEAEMGAEVKIGFVSPLTGPLADFGLPDKYCVDKWKAYIGDGIVGATSGATATITNIGITNGTGVWASGAAGFFTSAAPRWRPGVPVARRRNSA